jgi:hypothetical protein
MGKLIVGVTRVLPLCAVGLPPMLLVLTEAFAYGAALVVSPLLD